MAVRNSKYVWDKKHSHMGECYRCNHKWFRRSTKSPSACPACHSAVYYKKKRGKKV